MWVPWWWRRSPGKRLLLTVLAAAGQRAEASPVKPAVPLPRLRVVDGQQDLLDALEALAGGEDLVEAVAGFAGPVADAEERLVGVLDEVAVDGGAGGRRFGAGGARLGRGRHQRELRHLAP